jgi:cytochrome oxidase Cu insertion factor (SCO1/SenC/PrrC family)
MNFGKKSVPFPIQLILFSFVLVIFLTTTELPLKGEVDYLTQMGVIKVNQMSNAPGFVLSDIEGRKRSLSDFKGKFVMLNFWATW